MAKNAKSEERVKAKAVAELEAILPKVQEMADKRAVLTARNDARLAKAERAHATKLEGERGEKEMLIANIRHWATRFNASPAVKQARKLLYGKYHVSEPMVIYSGGWGHDGIDDDWPSDVDLSPGGVFQYVAGYKYGSTHFCDLDGLCAEYLRRMWASLRAGGAEKKVAKTLKYVKSHPYVQPRRCF